MSAQSGGALSYLRNIIPYFSGYIKESDITLSLLLTEEQKKIVNIPSGIEVYTVDSAYSLFKRLMWERSSLMKLVREKDYDVVFTPYQLSPYIKGVTNITMIRNMEPFFYGKYKYALKTRVRNFLLNGLSSRCLKRSDYIIACSLFALEYLREDLNISNEKIRHIYHGRDKSFSPELNSEDSKKLERLGITNDFIFTCGSLLPYRKCEEIIDSYAKSSISKKISLVIAGSGSDQSYVNLIKEKANQAEDLDIKLIGHVSPEDMKVLYRHCRVFVTATEIEACPNIAIEAMSSGCHIISSDNKPLPEIFANSAAFYSKDDSSLSLVRLLDETPLLSSLVNEKALKRAEDFDWEKCAFQTLSFLKDCN